MVSFLNQTQTRVRQIRCVGSKFNKTLIISEGWALFVNLGANSSLNFAPKLPHLYHPCPGSVFKSFSMPVIALACLKLPLKKEKLIY